MVRQFITEGVVLMQRPEQPQRSKPSGYGLEEKKAIVAEVNETAASALSLVIADARGSHRMT